MKWLTKDQVEKAAKRGTKAALLNCKKHWEQMIAATKEDFESFEDIKVLDCTTYCALCAKYYYLTPKCNGCPLKCQNNGLWEDADNAFDDMLYTYDDIDIKAFRKQARRLLAKINETIKKLYG